MKLKFFQFICLLLLIAGCKDKGEFKEVEKQGITVQLIEKQVENGLQYNVRIIPDAGYSGTLKSKNEKMYYHADSCFKVQKQGAIEDIIATAVEPIASGFQNQYEYLIYFDDVDGPYCFIYHDKYLSGQLFEFDFEN